jgi:putative phage-type endonuclease
MNTFTDQSLIQGSNEWLELRKTKVTATDARVVMGVDLWKTPLRLFKEKTSNVNPFYINKKMQRGLDLEDEARELFRIKTGVEVMPKVVVKNWTMASLDGVNQSGNFIVEIKCPGEKDHSAALSGKIPDHYYPQLQHQMFVCDVGDMYYFSYDGLDGVIIKVERDDRYIAKMLNKELEFYECLVNRVPPKPTENDYTERNDEQWLDLASEWKCVREGIKYLEKQEEEIRKKLIQLTGESNSRGAGISLSKITRKGNINYSIIPEIKNIDLEPYRRDSTYFWKINEQLSAT